MSPLTTCGTSTCVGMFTILYCTNTMAITHVTQSCTVHRTAIRNIPTSSGESRKRGKYIYTYIYMDKAIIRPMDTSASS